ncbi:MAG: hypothetical protein U0P82_04340 [Vicinamibacterales bacterium]
MSRVNLRWRIAAAVVVLTVTAVSTGPAAQGGTHLTIPYLANETTPTDLDYAAAECDIAPDDRSMSCRFRQLFITVTTLDPTLCAVTTNGYELRLDRESRTRWIGRGEPEGECGVVETTTLDDEGGTRWTMRIRTNATRNLDRALCREAAAEQLYDWKAMRRRLPCSTIQPGAIER